MAYTNTHRYNKFVIKDLEADKLFALRNQVFESCTFSSETVHSKMFVDFEGSRFIDCTFKNFQSDDSFFNFKKTYFLRCRIENSHFYGTNLEKAVIDSSYLVDSSFRPAVADYPRGFTPSLERLAIRGCMLKHFDIAQAFRKIHLLDVTIDVSTARNLSRRGKAELLEGVGIESLSAGDLTREFNDLTGAKILKVRSEMGSPSVFNRTNFTRVFFSENTVLRDVHLEGCLLQETDLREVIWSHVRLEGSLFRKIKFPKRDGEKLLPAFPLHSPKKVGELVPLFLVAAERYHSDPGKSVHLLILCLFESYRMGSRFERFKKGAWNRHHLKEASALIDLASQEPPLSVAELERLVLATRFPAAEKQKDSRYGMSLSFAQQFLRGWVPETGDYSVGSGWG